MDGLEAVEIRLSEVVINKDFRCDSGFWTTIIHKNKTLNYEKIGNLLISSQYGISIDMNEDGIGIPIYRMNEINNMLCVNSVEKYAEVTEGEMSTFKLNNKDVLFNRTNSFEWVGRTGVFYKNNDSSAIFASYLVRFVPQNNRILPEYLAAFLSCEHGVKAVKGRARQSINQTNVNPEEVKEIEIPLIDLLIQRKIEHCFEVANRNIVIAEEAYQSAETLLLSHLGLDNYVPNPSGIAVKTLSSSFGISGRLDSEYYQPKYDEIEAHIKNYSNGYVRLDTYINSYSTGFPYKSDEYIEDGDVSLIRINNISNGRLDLSSCAKVTKEIANQSVKDFVKSNDILISMSGTIGNSCCIVDNTTAVINQRIFKITPQNINPLFLSLFINSQAGNTQLQRIGTGGVQTNISGSDIKNIFVPKIEPDKQKEIADKIEESFALRKKSTELLELAKTAVEVAIELGEDAAMKMLEGAV